MSADEAEATLQKYAEFIDKTLKPELERRVAEREKAEEEIAEYQELREQLESKYLKTATETTTKEPPPVVDLGHGLVYAKAEIKDPTKVFVHVGMGFHIEFTIDEAVAFVENRLEFLHEQILKPRVERAKEVAEHVENSVVMMGHLAKEIEVEKS